VPHRAVVDDLVAFMLRGFGFEGAGTLKAVRKARNGRAAPKA